MLSNIFSTPQVRGRSSTNTQRLPRHRLSLMPSQNASRHVPFHHSKSECMRFVHSCCSLVLFFSRNALDSGCALRLLINMGPLVQPRSVCVEVPHNIAHQIA